MKTSTNNPRSFARLAGAGAIAAMLASGMAACRGERSDKPPRQFLPDMDDSPKFKPQAQADFFEDGRAMRKPVPGTVPFGYSTSAGAAGRAWAVADDPAVFEGIDASKPRDANNRPAYQATIPEGVFERMIADAAADGRTVSRAQVVDHMLERGQQRFNIYCSACHGYQGEGGGGLADGRAYGGLVGQRWASPVPTYHDAKYKDRAAYTGQDGYLFSVIRHGVPGPSPELPPNMPSYADKVSIPDSWAIVLYVRALQASRTENMQDVPADERPNLERSRRGASRSQSDAPAAATSIASTETNR